MTSTACRNGAKHSYASKLLVKADGTLLQWMILFYFFDGWWKVITKLLLVIATRIRWFRKKLQIWVNYKWTLSVGGNEICLISLFGLLFLLLLWWLQRICFVLLKWQLGKISCSKASLPARNYYKLVVVMYCCTSGTCALVLVDFWLITSARFYKEVFSECNICSYFYVLEFQLNIWINCSMLE